MAKTKRKPSKSSRKPPSPSGMNEYCYKVSGTADVDSLKIYLEKKIYRNPKFEDHFSKKEALPFVIVFSSKDNIICIKMTSKSQKNLSRIQNIHSKLTSKDLSGAGVILSKPELFELEQCNWWGGGCKFGEIQKWKTLEHNGPYFPHIIEKYKPHKAPLIYDGKKYILSPAEEKIANFYASRIVSERKPGITVYWTKDPVFNENFFEDFKTYLTPEHRKIFKDWKKLNFENIADELESRKENETKEEKLYKKAKAAERKLDYGYAIINGTKEPVGNFTVEPASIFLGRGENPKRGKIKREVMPEDVTINIGEKAKVPKPPKGHSWKEVIHNHEVSWLASWEDTISGDPKYVQFAAEGQLKGKSDFFKYEKARKLNHFIKEIREEYQKDINSPDLVKRQLGTVIYLIDHYGLRAGGEKSKEDTDTVGASTLRVEHIKLQPPDTVIFDFLGKDSIRYYKEIKVSKNIYRNIAEFLKGKNKGADLFNKISAADINAYLKSFDKSFTAKVFRTRLASSLMYDELKKLTIKKTDTESDKRLKFDRANVKVAETLNHQRTVSVKNKEVIEKYQQQLKELKKELKLKKKEGKNVESLKKRIAVKERQIQSKNDTLNVAMNTSRANYIDPRIVVAWCLTNDLDISKVYTAPMQKKFNWAISTTDADWDYLTTPLFGGMDELEPIEILETGPRTKASRSPRRKSIGKKSPPQAASPRPKTPSPRVSPSKTRTIEPLEIYDFSDRSIIVVGGTLAQKNRLRDLGGILKPSFKVKNKMLSGYIFIKNREEEIRALFNIGSSVEMNEINFYLNKTPSYAGYMFEEIMNWDKLKLERKHDYIQSLFPLPSKSKYSPMAPTLDETELKEFKDNDQIRFNVYRAYEKMLDFYGYSVNIKSGTISRVSDIEQKVAGVTVGLLSSHNLLRITRILTFLTLADFGMLADLLLLGLCEDMKDNEEFKEYVIRNGALKRWIKALGISPLKQQPSK